jgi:hypothetical protein
MDADVALGLHRVAARVLARARQPGFPSISFTGVNERDTAPIRH